MRNSWRLLPLVALLGACERASFAVANLPSHLVRTSVVRDVRYGPERWQKLDIYEPTSASPGPRPIIVFFYGGRWESGSRGDYEFVGDAFAKKGFITVIPDYSKYPDVRFPVFVEDGAKALAWVHDHISEYQGDPRRIFVAGHSAGAHIAALLTVDKHYLAALNKTPTQIIAGFAGLAGPYSFTPDEPDLQDMFGPPTRYPAMQATTFIDGHEPPMLLLWGDADTTVRRDNLDRLKTAIEAKGSRVQTIIYPGTNHVGILGALSWVNPQGVPVLDDIARFFKDIGADR